VSAQTPAGAKPGADRVRGAVLIWFRKRKPNQLNRDYDYEQD
jgi:hypothetical protein